MPLTRFKSDKLEPGKIYLYEYEVRIIPHTHHAKYKGVIRGRNQGCLSVSFRFFAPNDATAYAYLLKHFNGDDPRHLQQASNLSKSDCRLKLWDEDAIVSDLPRADVKPTPSF